MNDDMVSFLTLLKSVVYCRDTTSVFQRFHMYTLKEKLSLGTDTITMITMSRIIKL